MMDNNIPFYLQVKKYIKRQILDGDLNPGDTVKSERDLMEKFGLSRSTIRKAIKELVYEGYLVKVQGKGTFVSKYDIENNLHKIVNIHHKENYKLNEIRYKLLSEKLISDKNNKRALLDSISGEKKYFLERNLLLEDLVVGTEKIWSSPDFINQINDKSADEIEKLGKKTIEDISVVFPSKRQSNKLGINKNTPLLQIEKKIYLEGLIIFIQSNYNSQLVKLRSTSFNKTKYDSKIN